MFHCNNGLYYITLTCSKRCYLHKTRFDWSGRSWRRIIQRNRQTYLNEHRRAIRAEDRFRPVARAHAPLITSNCNQRQSHYINNTNSIIAFSDLPVIYAITPTYRRPEQLAELTRLAQTLLHVPSLHWIVVEDSSSRSPYIDRFLARIAIPYTHLNGKRFLISYADYDNAFKNVTHLIWEMCNG